jgi:beta-xylosidase
MKKNLRVKKFGVYLCLSAVSILLFLAPCFAQEKTQSLIKRTAYKTETVELGAGGTVSVIGAPSGSIKVEGWQKNAVEISAEVEMQAASEADLAELAKVNGFVIDNDFGHIRITSVGTHDKSYMKRVAKKFPKNLLTMPLKIDYVIKVPVYSDLNIDGGRGDLIYRMSKE